MRPSCGSSSPVVTATWLSRKPRSIRSRSVTSPRRLVEMTSSGSSTTNDHADQAAQPVQQVGRGVHPRRDSRGQWIACCVRSIPCGGRPRTECGVQARQHQPAAGQAEEQPGRHAQLPRTFAPAEQLGEAVDGHRQDQHAVHHEPARRAGRGGGRRPARPAAARRRWPGRVRRWPSSSPGPGRRRSGTGRAQVGQLCSE